ncbi:CIA30 family protein [uncultured Draconibacterium sp.]|uniref:CIA30 family protein n=1 Tax=uncultured Draconibacterium sp. TaxID=1573823 RepID=UPI0029C6DF94|nr:CIA30 family protein [uncultured Draconibacterium sp.]
MLVFIVIAFLQMNTTVLYDFSKTTTLEDWYTVNDGVMGGRSTSSFQLNEHGNAVFTGQVSLENNGGFSSVHYRFPPLETTGYQYLALRVKGDGKRYQVRIKDRAGDNYSYIAYFTTSGEWQDIKIFLRDMYPSFRGRTLDLPNFAGGKIQEFALLIGNKEEEAFSIEIDKIQLLKE